LGSGKRERIRQVRVGRLTFVLSALVALVALVASPALSAPPKKAGSGSDSGLPNAFAKGTAYNPRALYVRIDATPNQPVEVTYDTNCARRAKGRIREGEYTVTGNALTKLTKGFKRPDDCLFNVFAAYEDSALSGTIEIKLFARIRKK
jgi:hypothetical protein